MFNSLNLKTSDVKCVAFFKIDSRMRIWD